MDNGKKIIPKVEKVDKMILSYISKDKSSTGLGGMLSKITSARLAASMGMLVCQRNECILKGKEYDCCPCR